LESAGAVTDGVVAPFNVTPLVLSAADAALETPNSKMHRTAAAIPPHQLPADMRASPAQLPKLIPYTAVATLNFTASEISRH
jgi:hypothetical protein